MTTPSHTKPDGSADWSPLTLILGRIGLNVEYLPAPHHGIMLNPYFSSVSVGEGDSKTTFSSFGGEIGYHFYTGSRGANGLFFGPQLVYLSITSKDEDDKSEFSAYGVAFDIGWQHVAKGGFTIGVGGGFMYLKATTSPSKSSTTVKFEGTIPRLLFTIGYSF